MNMKTDKTSPFFFVHDKFIYSTHRKLRFPSESSLNILQINFDIWEYFITFYGIFQSIV